MGFYIFLVFLGFMIIGSAVHYLIKVIKKLQMKNYTLKLQKKRTKQKKGINEFYELKKEVLSINLNNPEAIHLKNNLLEWMLRGEGLISIDPHAVLNNLDRMKDDFREIKLKESQSISSTNILKSNNKIYSLYGQFGKDIFNFIPELFSERNRYLSDLIKTEVIHLFIENCKKQGQQLTVFESLTDTEISKITDDISSNWFSIYEQFSKEILVSYKSKDIYFSFNNCNVLVSIFTTANKDNLRCHFENRQDNKISNYLPFIIENSIKNKQDLDNLDFIHIIFGLDSKLNFIFNLCIIPSLKRVFNSTAGNSVEELSIELSKNIVFPVDLCINMFNMNLSNDSDKNYFEKYCEYFSFQYICPTNRKFTPPC